MNSRKMIRSLKLTSLVLLLACCSHSGAAQVTKTEVLPADGGELGKAFVELTDAFKTADKVRAAKYLDPTAWHLDDKQPSWFAQLAEQLATYSSIGGRRHGDRATLFVETKQPYYAMMNASYTAGRWQFDSPVPVGSSLNPSGRDCESSPTRFPCAAASAPDAQVSGTVQSQMIDPKTNAPARPSILFDGLAVHMIDEETKSLKSTWMMLSGTGINPRMVSLSEEPDQVKGWLSYPVLTLNVAPDGKSAKIEYFDGYSRKNLDVSSGLSIDMSVPNRIRGHLKTDAKDVANFDISFDIGTVSDCIADKYQCGD